MKKVPFDPGQMRQSLAFLRPTNPRNLSGGFGDAPEVLFTVRGKLERRPIDRPESERFSQTAGWTTNAIQYVATIRRRSDITESMQIRHDNRIFKIREAPQVAKSDRYMQILCEEVRA